MTGKIRGLHAGVAALIGAVALLAISQDWASLRIFAPGLPNVVELVSGQELAPLAAAALLAVLAASLALLALRRWAVYLVAGVMALAGLACMYGAVSYLVDPLARAVEVAGLGLAADVTVELATTGTVWPILLIGAGIGLLAVAVSLVVRMRFPGVVDAPTKYEQAKPAPSESGDAAIWDAQDGGLDLTTDRPHTT